MNGRVYDPKIGRFMSPDPSDATDPNIGFNRYAYVKNNPVSLVDPSGYEPITLGTAMAALAVTAAVGAAWVAYDNWRKSPEGQKALKDLKILNEALRGLALAPLATAMVISANSTEDPPVNDESWRNDPNAPPPSGHNQPPRDPLPCCPVVPGNPYHPDEVEARREDWQKQYGPNDDPLGPGSTPTDEALQGPGGDFWNGLEGWRGKTRTNAKTGKKRRYYEWDYKHNDIEVYDRRGKHLGSADPHSGEMTKDPEPGREIDVD